MELFIGSLLFALFAGIFGWWTLEPINRVAGQLQFSTRFMLTDVLGLMFMLQAPLAITGRAIQSQRRDESITYWVMLGLSTALVVVLWMASVSVVSRSGINRLWRRLCVIVVLIPGTLALIVAWPLALVSLIFAMVPPHNRLYIAALGVLGAAVLAVLTLAVRRLSFWALVGSPGEEILASLERGRTAAGIGR